MIKPLKVTSIEHDTEKKIMQAINDKGGYVIKNQASSTTGKGRPDLSACIKGKYYAIEVKRPKSSVSTTPYQIATLTAVAQAGGLAYYSKTAAMFNLKKYSVKTIHFKEPLCVNNVKPFLSKKDVLVIQIINDTTIRIYRRKDISHE